MVVSIDIKAQRRVAQRGRLIFSAANLFPWCNPSQPSLSVDHQIAGSNQGLTT
jgi:hypothetical protein